MSYFDSAYIAKFYLDEPESDAVRALAASLGRVCCSGFGRVEVNSEFHRKWREGAYGESAYKEICAQFDDDCAAGLWTWLPISENLIDEVGKSVRQLPRTSFLRSADALHIVSARENGLNVIYSNDRQLLTAAKYLNVKAKSV